MKPIIALLALATLVTSLSAPMRAQDEPTISFTGTPASHEVSFPTKRGFVYRLAVAPNVHNWLATDILEGGTGLPLTYGFSSTAAQLFYRVHRSNNPNKFLLPPGAPYGGPYTKSTGVPFHFYLDVFPQLPARIDIVRSLASGGPGTRIGRITEFAEIAGIKFVRGPVVWVPDSLGEYVITATAFDAAGNIMGTDVAEVNIVPDTGLTVQIIGGPPSPSATPQVMAFTAAVGSSVVKVEFYDNGVLIGYDDTAQPRFGDDLRDRNGDVINGNIGENLLMRGNHAITAKGYNIRGVAGDLSAPWNVVITGGVARPELQITSPTQLVVVQQGTPFDVTYTVSDPDGIVVFTDVSDTDSGVTLAVGPPVDGVLHVTASLSASLSLGITRVRF